MDRAVLGRQIYAARKERGFTSEKLSELCNINATYLRQIESGMKTPSLPVFVTICKQLGVSPNYLLPEAVVDSECGDLHSIMDLVKKATPGQIKMVTAMIKGAMDYILDE